MKKIQLLCLLGCMGAMLSVAAQSPSKNKTIRVNTADEFLANVGNNVTLEVGTRLDFSTARRDNVSAYVRYENVFDGEELVISGVSDFAIRGSASLKGELITAPAYGNVIVFENCTRLSITGIKAGHGEGKGYCTGGVFKFKGCSNVKIDKCYLYGSGIEGITAEDVSDFTLDNSTITDCTYSLLSMQRCKNILFRNSTFSNTLQFDMINLTACTNVRFLNSQILNNRVDVKDKSFCFDYRLFNIAESATVELSNCKIEGNNICYFANKKTDLLLKNTPLNNNTFMLGLYKEQ